MISGVRPMGKGVYKQSINNQWVLILFFNLTNLFNKSIHIQCNPKTDVSKQIFHHISTETIQIRKKIMNFVPTYQILVRQIMKACVNGTNVCVLQCIKHGHRQWSIEKR